VVHIVMEGRGVYVPSVVHTKLGWEGMRDAPKDGGRGSWERG
jgi:hypothetical protein